MITPKDINMPANTSKKLSEIKRDILSSESVKIFLKANEQELNIDMINNHLSVLKEYRDNQNHPEYKPELNIANGLIYITYIPRDNSVTRKKQLGLNTNTYFDESFKKYKDLTLNDYELTQHNAQAVKWVKRYITTLEQNKTAQGVWISGYFGIGKSYLVTLLANELKAKGIGVHLLGFSNLLNHIYTSLKYNDKSMEQIKDKHKRAEVLILDDMGTEKPTEFSIKNVLYDILNYRMEKQLSTVFTSNLTKQEYLNRLYQSGNLDNLDIGRLQQRIDALAIDLIMQGVDRRNKATFNKS